MSACGMLCCCAPANEATPSTSTARPCSRRVGNLSGYKFTVKTLMNNKCAMVTEDKIMPVQIAVVSRPSKNTYVKNKTEKSVPMTRKKPMPAMAKAFAGKWSKNKQGLMKP